MTVKTRQFKEKLNEKKAKFEYIGEPIIREYTGTAKEIMSDIRSRNYNNDVMKFSFEEIIDITD